MTTEITNKRIVSIISGPPIKWTGGIYRNRYQGAIVADGGKYVARVACLCGRDIQRAWDSLELAHTYMEAGIEMARNCDPFIEDGHDA